MSAWLDLSLALLGVTLAAYFLFTRFRAQKEAPAAEAQMGDALARGVERARKKRTQQKKSNAL